MAAAGGSAGIAPSAQTSPRGEALLLARLLDAPLGTPNVVSHAFRVARRVSRALHGWQALSNGPIDVTLTDLLSCKPVSLATDARGRRQRQSSGAANNAADAGRLRRVTAWKAAVTDLVEATDALQDMLTVCGECSRLTSGIVCKTSALILLPFLQTRWRRLAMSAC